MSALPSLKQLQYLVAISEQLNFTRAAESCFVTQSTLSAGLKELEEVLGTRLVERDRQSVLMTPLGLEVARRARQILASAQDLVGLSRQSSSPMSGQLRLGIIPTIAPFLLPPVLRCVRKQFPGLSLILREDLTASLLARLEDGQLDFVLMALPFATDTLLVEPLFEDRLWLVGLSSDPALQSRTASVSKETLARLLLLEEGHCLRDHTLFACGHTRPSASGGMEATSLLTLIQMVESGLGLALVPEMAVRCGLTESESLCARPLSQPGPSRIIALVARRSTTRLDEMGILAGLIRSVGSHAKGG